MIKIGIYGDNGHQITAEIQKNPEINAVIVAEACCKNEGKTGGIIYNSLDEMLENDEIELVSLCSPDRRGQAENAIKCLNAGKHVYAEKPCAFTLKEIEDIKEAAEKNNRQFHEMAGTVFAYPYFEMMQEIRNGEIGVVINATVQKSYPLSINTRPQDEDVDGGLTLQVGIHAMRMIEHMTGLQITDIAAFETGLGNPENGDLKTAVSFSMVLENGATAAAVANYLNPKTALKKHGYECVRIFGDKGMIETLDGAKSARIVYNNGEIREINPSGAFKSYLSQYIDALTNNTKMPFSFEEELHPLKALIKAKEYINNYQGRNKI